MIRMRTYLYVNALSALGSRMDLIACSALIFTFEHSAFWLTAFFVARQIGGILFSPIAGVLADRVDRRRAMIASDAGAGLALMAIVFFPHPYVVVAAAFLKGMLYSQFHVSFQSSLPQMFGQENLVKINGLTVRLESVVGILGFALGGVLTDGVGYSSVIVIDAASFFLSAAVLSRMSWGSGARSEAGGGLPGAPIKAGTPGHETVGFRAALAYLGKEPVLLAISLLALFESISTASHNYGLPFLAQKLAAGDSLLHGLMWSAMSLGAMGGSYVAARWRTRLVVRLFAASVMLALTVALAFMGTETMIVLVMLTVAGLFAGGAQVYGSSLLQQADNEIRGRVIGVQSTLSRIGFFIGFVAAPPLAGQLGLFGMVAGAQLLFLFGLLGLAWYCLRKR